MKILIPLAGRGSRFKEIGFTKPKSLLPIIDKSMIEWSTMNIPVDSSDIIFLILKDDVKKYSLDAELLKIFGSKITIIQIPKVTDGAPQTLLYAKDLINTSEEIIIWNGDQVVLDDVGKMIEQLPENIDGLIPVFHSNLTKFSYVRVDDEMNVLETAEKIPISEYATIGLYYFRKGKDFVRAAESMIEKDIRRGNEFFVCPVYNELIEEGKKIKATVVDTAWPLGTPEDVEQFKKYYRE